METKLRRFALWIPVWCNFSWDLVTTPDEVSTCLERLDLWAKRKQKEVEQKVEVFNYKVEINKTFVGKVFEFSFNL